MLQLKSPINRPAPDTTFRTYAPTTDRIVRPNEAVVITGRSLASIWRDEQAGTFPPRIRLGANSVGYKLSALMAWMDTRETITNENVTQVCVGALRGRKPAAKAEV